jgi:hypothetical protein
VCGSSQILPSGLRGLSRAFLTTGTLLGPLKAALIIRGKSGIKQRLIQLMLEWRDLTLHEMACATGLDLPGYNFVSIALCAWIQRVGDAGIILLSVGAGTVVKLKL